LCKEEEDEENSVEEDEDRKSGISKAVRRMRFKSFADDVPAEARNSRVIKVNLMMDTVC
jgi:hypothetical protein